MYIQLVNYKNLTLVMKKDITDITRKIFTVGDLLEFIDDINKYDESIISANIDSYYLFLNDEVTIRVIRFNDIYNLIMENKNAFMNYMGYNSDIQSTDDTMTSKFYSYSYYMSKTHHGIISEAKAMDLLKSFKLDDILFGIRISEVPVNNLEYKVYDYNTYISDNYDKMRTYERYYEYTPIAGKIEIKNPGTI